ncbi:MAG TPA: hypothetical protein VNC50_09975 [Planctomycetia bacterium]|nr:hypothetical protein [Planctomycetia bacterium]
MGFLSGRVGFERFYVGGDDDSPLGEKQVKTLEKFAIGSRGALSADGVSVGFLGGDHVLDDVFDLEKNVVNDALVFAIRVDATKPPSDLKKAYLQMEIAALAKDNPSGFPTKKQKAEAKETVEERINQEAEDGRWDVMKQFPAMWDFRQNIVYFASSSQTAIERFGSLFNIAFGRPLTRLTAGGIGYETAADLKQKRAYEDLKPSAFVGPADRRYEVAWIQEDRSQQDFLGNEFLLWLWWSLDARSDAIKLNDESSAICMMSRTLSLECPLAETGKETISHESPVRLPEAKRAILSGKLPRKSGLTLIRHDEQYDFTVTAETLAVSSAALPKLESETLAAERQDRIDQIRHFTESLDLLYDAFIRRRLSAHWAEDLKKLRVWLQKEED